MVITLEDTQSSWYSHSYQDQMSEVRSIKVDCDIQIKCLVSRSSTAHFQIMHFVIARCVSLSQTFLPFNICPFGLLLGNNTKSVSSLVCFSGMHQK